MKQYETALIVIDMQADYIGEKSKNKFYSQTLIDKINERIATASRHGDTVIYIKNVGRRNKKTYVSEFVEGLTIVSNYIVEKDKSSIFSNPTLLEILKENKIHNIECIGIDGNCCVASSAIDASKLGYSVIFPLTYIGIKSMERFSKKREQLTKANVQIIEMQEENI
jgi:nicotinamidase-related amidase